MSVEIGGGRLPAGGRGRLPRSAPNECLYQFVSIVFEYFYTFVTILIPCGRGRLDRCFFLILGRLIAGCVCVD